MDIARLRFALDVLTEGEPPESLVNSLAVFEPDAAQTRPDTFVEQVRRLRRDLQHWVLAPGVQGVGVGEKITGSRRTGVLGLTFFVERKLLPDRLARDDLIKGPLKVPGLDELVELDVEPVGLVRPTVLGTRIRPAPGGAAVGTKGFPGTLGCLVGRESEPGTAYVLSNSHVIAQYGFAANGTQVLQPGADSGILIDNVIAEIANASTDIVPFKFSNTQFDNLVDAAIGRVTNKFDPSGSALMVTPDLRVLGVPPGPPPADPWLNPGAPVYKIGARTDLTFGQVIYPYCVFSATGYPANANATQFGRVGFAQQVAATYMTQGGDSGSVVLDGQGRAVGLVWGMLDNLTLFSRIQNVFDLLDVELVQKWPA